MTPRWTALVVMAAAVGLDAQAGQQATFRARREIVRVDVLVTDRGRAVTDLTPKDFEILDNGVPQEIDLTASEETRINAVLALDVSGSVAGNKLASLRGACKALLAALKPGDRAGLVGFSHAVVIGSGLTTDLPGVLSSLDRLRAAGGTALLDASYAGLMLGESDAGRSLLIVFSDGLDSSSWLTQEAVLDTAKRSAAVAYAVSSTPVPTDPIPGLTRAYGKDAPAKFNAAFEAVTRAQPSFLRDLTSVTGGSYFEIESMKNLEETFLRVLDEFRIRTILSYSPTGVQPGGWHKLEVRVRGRKGLTVKARPGYQAGS